MDEVDISLIVSSTIPDYLWKTWENQKGKYLKRTQKISYLEIAVFLLDYVSYKEKNLQEKITLLRTNLAKGPREVVHSEEKIAYRPPYEIEKYLKNTLKNGIKLGEICKVAINEINKVISDKLKNKWSNATAHVDTALRELEWRLMKIVGVYKEIKITENLLRSYS